MDTPSGSKICWIGMETESNWNGEIGKNNDIIKWIWKWNGMEMEKEWNLRFNVWNASIGKL